MDDVISIEIRRALRRLEAFCRQRNRGGGQACGELRCIAEDEGLRIVCRRDGQQAILIRCLYDGQAWNLWLPKGSSRWQPYPHLPRAVSVEQIIDELEQAPMHVHW